MTTFMKLSLGVVILAGATACEGGPETVGSFGKTDASAAKDGAAGDGGGAGEGGDAGETDNDAGGTKGDAGGGGNTCTVKESSGTPACDTCEDSKCCAKINACFDDKDCAAIVACSNHCYDDNPKEPDGGKVPDGGADDCSNACVAAGTTAGQALFNAQNDCVGMYCQKECWGP
jgi:hypothetical protein